MYQYSTKVGLLSLPKYLILPQPVFIIYHVFYILRTTKCKFCHIRNKVREKKLSETNLEKERKKERFRRRLSGGNEFETGGNERSVKTGEDGVKALEQLKLTEAKTVVVGKKMETVTSST
ncbi:hypothetical protein YC2023_075072 [Brassica napus]